MNRTLLNTILGIALMAAIPAQVAAQVQDTTAPALTAFDFAPKTIDATGGATVTATFSGTDEVSGMAGFYVTYISPSGQQNVNSGVGGCTGLSCTASLGLGFPLYNTEGGVWTVASVMVIDVARNTKVYNTAELAVLGFPTELTVGAGVQDATPPVLTAFDFAPKTIDATEGATVTATFSGTDEVSGMAGFYVTYISPSGQQNVNSGVGGCTGLSCTASLGLGFPLYNTEAGVWTVASVMVIDVARNTKVYNTAELAALGFPTELLNTYLQYNFSGFFRPVDNLPTMNVAKAGSGIPVKWSLGGYQGMDICAAGYPASAPMPSDPTQVTDEIDETVTAGNSSLNYDAGAGQYIYVWKTQKAWAGTSRQLVIKLKDGTYHRANFKFTK